MRTHTHTNLDESFFERVADLPLTIDGDELALIKRGTAGGATRTTTIVSLHSDGTTGVGEDITSNVDAHHALASVFYPNGPNDIAPTGYNDPEPCSDLPENPLTPPRRPERFGWT